MGRVIVHHDGQFLEWSSVVDAPVTFGMPEAEFREYYRSEYGERGMDGLDARLSRAVKNGTSSLDGETMSDLFACNRAGPNEAPLSDAEIIRAYFIEKRDPGR